MTDLVPIPVDVLRELKLVRDQVWDVFGQWHLFTGLFATQESVDAIAWAFRYGAGGLIQQALRTEIAVGLGRVLDRAIANNQRPNLSVERMVSHVEMYRPLQADGMQEELVAVKHLYAPLKLWRDKYHAHRDHAVAMGVEIISSVDQAAMECVFSALRRLVDRIWLALDGSTTPYEKAYDKAAEQLLALVLPQYQASRERLRIAEESI